MSVRMPEPRSERRLLMTAGHYGAWLIAGLIPVTIATSNKGIYDGPAGIAGTILVTLLLGSWLAGTAQHTRSLCGRCAASTPLDPQAAVRRWRPVLKIMHSRRAACLSVTVAGLLIGSAFLPGGQTASPAIIMACSGIAGATWLQIASTRHQRLQPWCPWCHWDDGGDEEVTPEVPDPAMSL